MSGVLMATILIGYVACAAAFYFLAARTAMTVQDNATATSPQVVLTVAEGGASENLDHRQAA